MEINNEYFIYKLININFGDPISSILLTPGHVIIGTMLGQISCLSLLSKKISILSEANTENISNISYNSNDDIINISIGDEKILRYKKDKRNPEKLFLFQKISNYANEMEHNNFCQNAYTSLSSEFLFRIQLSPPEEKCLNIIEIENEYDILNIINREVIFIGRLPMTNYIVPFGFDGEYFAWVEFIGPGERNICVANVINNLNNNKNNNDNMVDTYKIKIEKNFGHISHLKILNESKIFLVHNLNICEIRLLNKEFTLIESFKHIGDEVFAVDIYYPNGYLKMKNIDKISSDILLYDNNDNNDNKDNKDNILKISKNDKNLKKTYVCNNNSNNNNLNNKEENNKSEDNIKLEKSKTVTIVKKIKNLYDNNNINYENENNTNSIKKKSDEDNSDNSEFIKSNKIKNINLIDKDKNIIDKESNSDLSFSIITLDIDGNVNLYQYGKESTLFNIYNLKDISQKMKNNKFFSMGYEYYIKTNHEYFCISTDYGCLVIKKYS